MLSLNSEYWRRSESLFNQGALCGHPIPSERLHYFSEAINMVRALPVLTATGILIDFKVSSGMFPQKELWLCCPSDIWSILHSQWYVKRKILKVNRAFIPKIPESSRMARRSGIMKRHLHHDEPASRMKM